MYVGMLVGWLQFPYYPQDIQMKLIQRIEELKTTTNPMLPAKVGANQLEEQNVPPVSL